MVDFVYVVGGGFSGAGYRVQHCKPRGDLEQFLQSKKGEGLDDVVFAAFIKSRYEFWSRLPSKVEGQKIQQVKVGELELAVVRSKLEIYGQTVRSGSEDSNALYLGHFLREGENFAMLLQYLARNAHTSVHSHNIWEVYVQIYGSAKVFLVDVNSENSEKTQEVEMGGGSLNVSALVVPKNFYHPIKAVKPTLTLIIASPGIVADHVNSTRSNHNYGLPFTEFCSRFLASGT